MSILYLDFIHEQKLVFYVVLSDSTATFSSLLALKFPSCFIAIVQCGFQNRPSAEQNTQQSFPIFKRTKMIGPISMWIHYFDQSNGRAYLDQSNDGILKRTIDCLEHRLRNNSTSLLNSSYCNEARWEF